MSVLAAGAMIGALVGFVGGCAFSLWWFREHIAFAERTPGFRSGEAE